MYHSVEFTKSISHHFETMVETITFVGIYRGTIRNQGFLRCPVAGARPWQNKGATFHWLVDFKGIRTLPNNKDKDVATHWEFLSFWVRWCDFGDFVHWHNTWQQKGRREATHWATEFPSFRCDGFRPLPHLRALGASRNLSSRAKVAASVSNSCSRTKGCSGLALRPGHLGRLGRVGGWSMRPRKILVMAV